MHGKTKLHRWTRLASILAVSASLVLLTAAHRNDALAGGSEANGSPAAADPVTISDPWARETPAGARMGSVYLTIVSAAGDRLLRASVPRSVAARTQIHETIVRQQTDGGGESMTMRQVPSLELPPGREVELKPGGFHLMLIDLKHPLKAGDKVAVTLRFERAGKRTVTADVRGL